MSLFDHAIPDKVKRRIKTVTNLVGKARDLDTLAEDLEDVDDPVVDWLWPICQETIEAVDSDPHRENMRKVLVLGLWTITFDTAYREPARYLLGEALGRAWSMGLIDGDGYLHPDVKVDAEPENWHVNAAERAPMRDPDEVLDE